MVAATMKDTNITTLAIHSHPQDGPMKGCAMSGKEPKKKNQSIANTVFSTSAKAKAHPIIYRLMVHIVQTSPKFCLTPSLNFCFGPQRYATQPKIQTPQPI